MKLCERCKEDISHKHKNAKYCDWCAIHAKKEYQKQYMKQFPKSARNGRYYKYYKFLMILKKDELMALYTYKRNACKEKNVDKRKINTQLLLITEAYKRKGEE